MRAIVSRQLRKRRRVAIQPNIGSATSGNITKRKACGEVWSLNDYSQSYYRQPPIAKPDSLSACASFPNQGPTEALLHPCQAQLRSVL
eukprot:12520640-Prorocentrum_lima.AAC.1